MKKALAVIFVVLGCICAGYALEGFSVRKIVAPRAADSFRLEARGTKESPGDKSAAQVFELVNMWEEGLLEYDATKGIDWSWLSMDGAMTKAPLGGEKKRAQSNRPWQARRQKELAVRYKRNPSGAGD